MNASTDSKIAVLGAGSWGTALSIELCLNGNHVTLWDHNPEHIKTLSTTGYNQQYVPDIPLPESLCYQYNLSVAIADADFILVAVPSHGFRSLLKKIADLHHTKTNSKPLRLAWATKGLEPNSGKFLDQVAVEELGADCPLAVISGPSFALEVARNLPTAVTIASNNPEFSDTIVHAMHCKTFRTYTSDDLIGIEVGGAVKNVLAIAAGISDGLGFGANARAALITRGLTEMIRLGKALGGNQDTFMGLAGIGDLVLTCTDDQSRNRRLGIALGQGISFDAASAEIGQAIEGAHTSRELALLAKKQGIEMPITELVNQVIYHGLSPSKAVESLLTREQKSEQL